MMRASGSFVVNLMFVLDEFTMKVTTSYMLSDIEFNLTKFISYLAPLL